MPLTRTKQHINKPYQVLRDIFRLGCAAQTEIVHYAEYVDVMRDWVEGYGEGEKEFVIFEQADRVCIIDESGFILLASKFDLMRYWPEKIPPVYVEAP